MMQLLKIVLKRIGVLRLLHFLFGPRLDTVLNEFRKKNISTKFVFLKFSQGPLLESASTSSHDLRIIWFMPDVGVGSGGHLNAFRMIKNLEKLGCRSSVAICKGRSPDKIKKVIQEHFFNVDVDIYLVENEHDLSAIEGIYDIAMATSWESAYYVRAFGNCRKRGYFVQDFEPYFYPKGSQYNFAEDTYNFGFFGVTAGHWLKKKLSQTYGMHCESYSFSFDKGIYEFKFESHTPKNKIFFYARPMTARREFELGLIALQQFAVKYPGIEVLFAGENIKKYEIPFTHKNLGILKMEDLPAIYRNCDAALILSATNLSLLPLEVVASGGIAVLDKGEHNEWLDPDNKVFFYCEQSIDSICETLEKVYLKQFDIPSYIETVTAFLNKTSWENEAEKIYHFLKNKVDE